MWSFPALTQWGLVTHICFNKLTIIASDNGLSPGRRQVIIWTNAGILLIRTLGTNFSEIINEIHTFSFKKTYLKMSSAKWQPFCLSLNELNIKSTRVVQGDTSDLIMAQLHHMIPGILVKTGSGDGLLHDGTKPLPGLILNKHQQGPLASTRG